MSSIRQILVLCLLASSLNIVFGTQASERSAQSVELTFYQLSTSEWSNTQSSFKTLVAAEAATYCTNNAATCGLSSGFLFTANEVGVDSGPTEESKSLKISFYIDFPTVHVVDGSSTTTYVVNSAAVTTILTNIRNSLEDAVGADITYIDSEFYSISPASTMNKVLIPIAFIVLLAIIILAVALHMWNKRKEREAKKKQRALDREKRKKTSRITPMYTMEMETKKSTNFWPRRSRKAKTGTRQDTNGNVPVLSMRTNMMTFDTSGAANQPTASAEGNSHYEEVVPVRNNALPPLPNPTSEDETKEEKKKREKKEKKRRKREKRQHKEPGEEESSEEFSKTESLDKTGAQNIIAVEDEAVA